MGRRKWKACSGPWFFAKHDGRCETVYYSEPGQLQKSIFSHVRQSEDIDAPPSSWGEGCSSQRAEYLAFKLLTYSGFTEVTSHRLMAAFARRFLEKMPQEWTMDRKAVYKIGMGLLSEKTGDPAAK